MKKWALEHETLIYITFAIVSLMAVIALTVLVFAMKGYAVQDILGIEIDSFWKAVKVGWKMWMIAGR